MKVSAPRRKVMPRRPSRKGNGSAGSPQGSHMSRYAFALAHPFSPEAEGAKVPEPYAQPTVTYRFKRVVTLTTNAAGAVDFAVFPHLGISAAQYVGTSAGLSNAGPTNLPAGVLMYSSNANFQNLLRSYRVVSYGVRIKSNTTFNNTTGRIYVARVPAATDYPAWVVPAGTTLGAISDMMNIPIDSAGGITSSIIALPKAAQYTLSELHQESGVELITHPIGPSAIDFLDGVLTTGESPAGTAVNYQAGYYSGRGWQQFLIAGDGLPATAQVLTLEIIYHVEGTPLINSSTGASMIPSGMVAAVGSTQALNEVHSTISAMPFAQKLRDKAVEEAKHRAVGVLQRFGRRVAREAKSRVERGSIAADLLGVALA